MKQDFDSLIKNLKPTVATYKYYIDYDKVFREVEIIEKELSILDSLLKSENLEVDFINLIKQNPSVCKIIPNLLAIRKKKVFVINKKNGLEEKVFNFNNVNSINEIDLIEFMNNTGLFDLVRENKIKSFKDYLIGVEVGLNSNARKNRTGTAMEDIIEQFIIDAGLDYKKEMTKAAILKEYGVDINAIVKSPEGKKMADKRFDFTFLNNNKLYLIETNFYSSSGSKLNETARSFKALGQDFDKVENVEFIWITDGVGWKSARNNLREAYDSINHLYTLNDLESRGIKKIINNGDN